MGQLTSAKGFTRSKWLGVLVGASAVLAGAYWVFFAMSEKSADKNLQHDTPKPSTFAARPVSATNKVARTAPAVQAASVKVPPKPLQTSGGVTNTAMLAERTPDERDADAMRELLGSGDEKGALRIARRLIDSPDVDVRSSVVTAMGWIGVRALPELTKLLADEDEGVAAEALVQWKMAYDEIDDDASKAELLVALLTTMNSEADMESMTMSFSQLPEDLALRSLVQIIQGENPAAAEVAREQYAFIAQEEFTPEYARRRRENVEPQPQPEGAVPVAQ